MTPSASRPRPKNFEIAGTSVPSGGRARVEIPVARVATGSWLNLGAEVLNGVRPGPTVWLSGAVHGDEPIGVEVIRQVLDNLDPDRLSGCVVAIPIVNVFGFIAEARYLPDRRDLNRSFPGSPRGSMAAQLAHLFMTEVVARCDWGIDLHCGSQDRSNYPQVRGDLDDDETRRHALAFGAPVMIHSKPPKGSLRGAATKRGVRVILYEGGEAKRFDALAVRVGVRGIFRVLRSLEMLNEEVADGELRVLESRKTHWLRASRSGILRPTVELGETITKGKTVGVISDSLGQGRVRVRARQTGIVIGLRLSPVVFRGDAVAHIAETVGEFPSPD